MRLSEVLQRLAVEPFDVLQLVDEGQLTIELGPPDDLVRFDAGEVDAIVTRWERGEAPEWLDHVRRLRAVERAEQAKVRDTLPPGWLFPAEVLTEFGLRWMEVLLLHRAGHLRVMTFRQRSLVSEVDLRRLVNPPEASSEPAA